MLRAFLLVFSALFKFLIKKEMAIDYPVMALEGLWWTNDILE
jgi:hypothetical protein